MSSDTPVGSKMAEETVKMAEEAFEAGGGEGEAGEGTSFESVFESVKTSLPGLGESDRNLLLPLPLYNAYQIHTIYLLIQFRRVLK